MSARLDLNFQVVILNTRIRNGCVAVDRVIDVVRMKLRMKQEQLYEAALMQFLKGVLENPGLNHRGHGPKPKDFGVSEKRAKEVRVRVLREMAREA